MKDLSKLTLDDKIKEITKVAKSFNYFLNEYVFIEDKERNIAMKLRLWPEQERVVKEMLAEKLIAMLKARQLGMTWLVAAYVLWKSLCNQLHLSIIISTTEELSKEFLERVYFIMDRLPPWMKPPIKSRTVQTLEFQHANNLVSTIKSLPTTEMGAQSKTPNILVLDETCTNRLVASIFNASYPGIEQAKGQVVVISNSIKVGAGWYWTRDLVKGALRGSNRFKPIFMDWKANPNRPPTFKDDMLQAGMNPRDVEENYPDTIDQALEDRNIKGVYYAKQMGEARREGRIGVVPWVQGHEVYTFWDLGIDDSMSIWFMQQIGMQFRFIDYYENSGMGLAHYAKVLKDKPYVYGDHYMPHDAAKREMGGDTDVALSRQETAENLGILPIIIVKKAKDSQAVLNAIDAGRNMLGQCCFDAVKCARGIECLEAYRSEWDEENEKLGNKPLHSWACHGADSWRTFAQGYMPKTQLMPFEKQRRPTNLGGGLSYLGS